MRLVANEQPGNLDKPQHVAQEVTAFRAVIAGNIHGGHVQPISASTDKRKANSSGPPIDRLVKEAGTGVRESFTGQRRPPARHHEFRVVVRFTHHFGQSPLQSRARAQAQMKVVDRLAGYPESAGAAFDLLERNCFKVSYLAACRIIGMFAQAYRNVHKYRQQPHSRALSPRPRRSVRVRSARPDL